MNHTRTLSLLAGTALLAAAAPSAHALVAAGPYTFVASLPLSFTPSVKAGSADALLFTFGSPTGGSNFQAAKFVGSSFVFDSGYQVDVVSSVLSGQTTGHYGYTLDSNNQIATVSLYNNGAANTLSFSPPYTSSASGDTKTTSPTSSSLFLAFSSVGSTAATMTLGFYDDPTIAPFTLSEVYSDPTGKTVTKSLLAGNFSPNGFTPSGVGPGAAVPEASGLSLLGLGLLPLGLLAIRRRRMAA